MIVVSLNTDRHPMCFVGKYMFNFNEPGPVKIKVDKLSKNEINQFVYNYRCGILSIENVDELLNNAAGLPATSNKFKTSKEAPIQQKIPSRDIIEQDESTLKKLLREKIEDIKDTVAVMSPSKIRKLIELENSTKKRKKLLKYLQEILEQHTNSVKNTVGTKEITFRDVISPLGVEYTQDIEETDVTQITINQIKAKE